MFSDSGHGAKKHCLTFGVHGGGQGRVGISEKSTDMVLLLGIGELRVH